MPPSSAYLITISLLDTLQHGALSSLARPGSRNWQLPFQKLAVAFSKIGSCHVFPKCSFSKVKLQIQKRQVPILANPNPKLADAISEIGRCIFRCVGDGRPIASRMVAWIAPGALWPGGGRGASSVLGNSSV